MLENSFITGGGFSSHWVPYWHWCTPCSVKFDAVVKLEDPEYMLQVSAIIIHKY